MTVLTYESAMQRREAVKRLIVNDVRWNLVARSFRQVITDDIPLDAKVVTLLSMVAEGGELFRDLQTTTEPRTDLTRRDGTGHDATRRDLTRRDTTRLDVT